MASGRLRRAPKSVERRALRALSRSGCGGEDVRRLVGFLEKQFPDFDERIRGLERIAEFVTAIGRRAAKDYFLALRETGAYAQLTSREVIDFARSVDPHTAEWYFWAMWGTKAVPELTADAFLRQSEFFRSIGEPAVVEYFVALRETREARALTDQWIFEFARGIGPEAAVEYFGSLWESNDVASLTAGRVRAFALALGSEAAREYFLAVRETRKVREMTDLRLLLFVETEGRRVAVDYFRAIRRTGEVERLTGESVRLFAESIGKPSARAYFQVLSSTRATSQLTSEPLLRAAGVIRSIGSEAAMDYFLAAAAGENHAPAAREGAPGEEVPFRGPDGGVPVLTLLDIPTYSGYRAAALAGVTALYWASFTSVVPGALAFTTLPLAIVAGLAAWSVLLAASYLLVDRMADRSASEFLNRRRRLLNEHGIRWHDCGTTDRRCPLCWRPDHTHADARFDCERFCRCPAC